MWKSSSLKNGPSFEDDDDHDDDNKVLYIWASAVDACLARQVSQVASEACVSRCCGSRAEGWGVIEMLIWSFFKCLKQTKVTVQTRKVHYVAM